jgi:hypothetical protein
MEEGDSSYAFTKKEMQEKDELVLSLNARIK